MNIINKEDAITTIKLIQHGAGLNRKNFPENLKGSIAKNLWDKDEIFTYGMEYGYILALLEAFDIKESELR